MGLALRVHRSAPSETEQRLAAAVRNGDDAAFEELFARYRDRIRAYVLTAVGDHGRAEDITQDVFLAALRRLRATERPIAFKPWIYEIAKNACIDEFRRARRTTEVPLTQYGDSSGSEIQLPSPQPPPDVIVEERQRFRNLRGAFGGLSDNHHRILVMRELEGRSYGEIGERLGMTRAMVESTLFRARRRLNQEFNELESGRRCEHVRAAIDRSERRSLRVLGIRERRQVARHMAHCPPCRQYAWTAGFDAGSLERIALAEKIAALLPVGWWNKIRHLGRAPSVAAAKATPKLARYGEPVSQVGLGRAIAAVAAVAVAAAGGGYAATSTTSHRVGRAHPAAATVAALTGDARAASRSAHAARVEAVAKAALLRPRARRLNGAADHGPRVLRQQGGGAPASAAGLRTSASSALPRGASSATRTSSSGSVGASSGTGSTTSGYARHAGNGGQRLIGSLLGGRSPSSGGHLPAVASAPSVQVPSVNAPSSAVPAPVDAAAKTAGQVVNTAGQVVTGTTGTVGGAANNLVGGVLPGSGQ
jgi:RNA polymerase sigma factor (sigma-70 family)